MVYLVTWKMDLKLTGSECLAKTLEVNNYTNRLYKKKKKIYQNLIGYATLT